MTPVPLPASVYHYTNLEGALAILRNGTIRATHIDFMNDRGERAARADIADLVSRLPTLPEPTPDWLTVAAAINTNIEWRNDTLWVACFTDLQDDVGMWRGYGDSGVCIEFDRELLVERTRPEFFERVLYLDPPLVGNLAVEDMISRLSTAWARKGEAENAGTLAGLTALVKSNAWRAEAELRLVLFRHTHQGRDALPHAFDGMEFTDGRYGVRPSIDLEYGDPRCVRSIRVGPGPFQSENAAAFQLVAYEVMSRFRQVEHVISVVPSEIDMR